jgi:hypothetical protein
MTLAEVLSLRAEAQETLRHMQPGLPPAAPPATTLRQYPVCVLDWDMEWFDRRLLQQDMENGRARFRTLSNGLYRDLYKLRRHVQRHHLALAPPAVREEFPRYIDTAPDRQYPVELLRPLIENIQEMLRSMRSTAHTGRAAQHMRARMDAHTDMFQHYLEHILDRHRQHWEDLLEALPCNPSID